MVILLFIALLMIFIFFGFPVAFAFITINIFLTILFIGYKAGMNNLVNSAYDALVKFTLTPIPLFLVMGETLYHSGLVMRIIDAFSKLLGRMPARLSILAVGTGTVMSAMSGSAISDAAMLGSTLGSEMRKRGYHLNMIVGPIIAAATLALIIPPSTTSILLSSTARISVGDMLIAGILPGLLIAALTLGYFMIRAAIQPSLAPIYDVGAVSFKEKIRSFVVDAMPSIMLIVLVLGSITFGIATPTESAAVGAAGALVLAALYRKLNWQTIKTIVVSSTKVSTMILLIMAMSSGFSQLLAFTGATRGLVQWVLGWEVPFMVTIIFMLVIVLILGMFIDPISIMMITIPLYMPVITSMGIDPIWFGVLMLICLGLGNVTPPFGLLLFVIKGVMPREVRATQIYKAVISVVVIQLVAIVLIMIFPEIATWLPQVSKE
jgi:tripartite ATP-independent transporter DctM subunit